MVLACVALLPYLGKAFTIDDTSFLRQAEHAIRDPLHPAAFDFVWADVAQRSSQGMASGPVGAWLLIPTFAAGGSERIGHLTSLLLLLMGIAATVSLALRLEFEAAEARLAGLYLASMPAVIGMAATVMPDVGAAALGVLGIERLMLWSSTRRARHGASAAVALALSSLARGHLIALIGVGALLLVEGSPLSWRAWRRTPPVRGWPLVAALVLIAAVVRITRDPQGIGVAGAIDIFTSSNYVDRNLPAFFSHWTWSMSLGLAWCLLRGRETLRSATFWVAIPTALALLAHAGRRGDVVLGIAIALGFAAIAGALAEGVQSRDGRRLALAAWLLAAVPVVLYVHFPPKYLVASAPAAALLLARATHRSRSRWARVVGASVAIAGLVLGVLIVRADARLAGLERRAARREIAPRVAAGQRVWFSGHWGFQWYAEQAGARPLVRNRPPAAPGDVVVVDEQAFNQELINAYPKRRLLTVIVDDTPGGRVMNREANAGFYSNFWGDLPWGWTARSPVDRISVWQLE